MLQASASAEILREPSSSEAKASFAFSANVKRQFASSFLSADATESAFSPTATVKCSGLMLFLNVSSVRFTVTAAFLLSVLSIMTSASDLATVIVTEYGIADLRAKTSEERARALINIAAPEFKDELIENYVLRFKKEFS